MCRTKPPATHQLSDGLQAGVVAANLQHQGAALEGVGNASQAVRYSSGGGALGGLSLADGQGLLSGSHEHRGVVADQLLGVHEAVLAQQGHCGVDDQVLGLLGGRHNSREGKQG